MAGTKNYYNYCVFIIFILLSFIVNHFWYQIRSFYTCYSYSLCLQEDFDLGLLFLVPQNLFFSSRHHLHLQTILYQYCLFGLEIRSVFWSIQFEIVHRTVEFNFNDARSLGLLNVVPSHFLCFSFVIAGIETSEIHKFTRQL